MSGIVDSFYVTAKYHWVMFINSCGSAVFGIKTAEHSYIDYNIRFFGGNFNQFVRLQKAEYYDTFQ